MEQSKEKKYVCKYCSKKFACGKSLGGHIRTHNNYTSVDDSDEEECDTKLNFDENGGYRLRENPKKNKRFVDQREMKALKHHQQQLRHCRECGKGFVSTKALSGHMACHSDREKTVMESESDSEASSSPTIRKRSKRVVVHQSTSAGSSDVCEIEQMAMSLMMLSRDTSYKKRHDNFVVNSSSLAAESSDNNSVILETTNKSSLDDSDNSDSGYFQNGPKKSDSVTFNSSKKGSGSGHSSTKYDLRKSKRGFTPVYDIGEHSLETDSCGETNRTTKIHKPTVKKVSSDGKKKSKGHECPICYRVFKSGQALGGHKRSHFIGNQEHRTLVIQHTLIDLNLPAPTE